jgi:hypothetical protein
VLHIDALLVIRSLPEVVARIRSALTSA